MDNTSIQAWYASIPRITRALFTTSVVVPLVGKLGLVSPYSLLLLWSDVVGRLQIWRLATTFFFAQPGFGLMMNLYMLYRYSGDLETVTFAGRPADYAFFLLFCVTSSLAGSVLTGSMVLNEALILAVIHYWSHRNSERIVSFMFGTNFKARYMPMVLLGFDLLMSGSLPLTGMLGVASSYAYIQLMEEMPARGGRRWLDTPTFLRRFFPPGSGTPYTQPATYSAGSSTGVNLGRQSNTMTQRGPVVGGHDWGRGQRLGDQ
ncbi:Der1-like family-domain-containing protein [Thamnocephalis sphaerospora]|uniref:Derlin n=1 Tax=Thamnocephalis sphaerospora TaxID=78915 RepID=A0A4P9XU32_9FUNG|nr:Der1-like family-domain-containing protein [Thamnocephalis sphaerospora]|eukprot:RKP09717.1 Der1-like family-domain-containing protein [Thamnocephalis sphaerospora]